jgi:hypothetical protein
MLDINIERFNLATDRSNDFLKPLFLNGKKLIIPEDVEQVKGHSLGLKHFLQVLFASVDEFVIDVLR